MKIHRLYVEKINDVKAKGLKKELKNVLNISVEVKVKLRYDIQGLSDEDLKLTKDIVFSEPPIDRVSTELETPNGYKVFAVEFLPGQYDQRADSACQCVQLVTCKERPLIRCATVYMVAGVSDSELLKIKNYLINPVEAREASLDMPQDLKMQVAPPEKVKTLIGFIDYSDADIEKYHTENGFAMTKDDLKFVRDYFKGEKRNPTITEIKVIDTYWSDHCRHTTFATELVNVEIISENPHVQKAMELYDELYAEFNSKREDKYKCLMDIATIAVKKLKKMGLLNDLDESDEINACSIKVKINVGGKDEDYLVMFKNETHNHPTEIEPFGGAATCLGGAIRDPLSGRTYVYQAMRITGAADPTVSFDKTIKGKLPQRVITTTAAGGFSSYGNQIGLATGIVSEMYHDNYVAKRLETGFVVGANKADNVVRIKPEAGDVVMLLGGETGRDGCGGATGSSKAHTLESIEVCGAEVQKGNALTERKLQRLFRNSEITKLIKKCNDFGAGGVCVAIGELSDGIDIDLTKVPKKYDGLDGTELAISESQERMAVVIAKADEEKFKALAAKENLGAVNVATITDTKRMRMTLNGDTIVNIARDFLDTNGVRVKTDAVIREGVSKFFDEGSAEIDKKLSGGEFSSCIKDLMSDLNVCSQKGLGEIFDSTVGAGSVFMPFGGKYQLTPVCSMAAKVPTGYESSDTASVAAWGCSPHFMSDSPFVGSMHSIVTSVSKLIASGVKLDRIRLTLQEYFKRLSGDKERFGTPLSALLGALYTEIGLGLGAIGGKDSMSGTFENIDVPPTLISFALGIANASDLITNVVEYAKYKVYHIALPRDKYSAIDFKALKELYSAINAQIMAKNIVMANVVETGGTIAATIKSCIGNGFGADFNKLGSELFKPYYGDFIVQAADITAFKSFNATEIAAVNNIGKFTYGKDEIALSDVVGAFESKLEKVFKTTAENDKSAENISYTGGVKIACVGKAAKPRVFIPVFPGTNCEYDTAKKFINAGGEADMLIIKNRSQSDIEESISEIVKRVKNAQIIAFPGGFSGGDEPDGSAKFIVATFQNPRISEAVNELLSKRDGLTLGICNGFQALIKLGLIENGYISNQGSESSTLTYNNISRHVSTLADIRVSSNLSPWLAACNVGDVFKVAVSHGEGKFIAGEDVINRMIKNGQIATQYVDLSGNATSVSPFNPNGSYMAVEGATSPCGRVYGKMGHSERIGENLMKNTPGNFDMKLFESGIKYFK